MKKKLLSFIFAICLIIPAAFMLSACGTKEKEPVKPEEPTAITLTVVSDKGTNQYVTCTGKYLSTVLWENDVDIDDDNSIGFYLDENFTLPFDDSELTKNTIVYTKMATLDKITITGTGEYKSVDAKSTTIEGEVVIPASVKRFKETESSKHDGFANCTLMTSILISRGVTITEYSIFHGCTSLENIAVVGDNEYLSSVDGVMFTKDKTELLKYPQGKEVITYTVPQGTQYIGFRAFSECNNLVTVVLQEGVKVLGQYAFANCGNLISIQLPNSLERCESISTFSNCSKLSSITIPSNFKFIALWMFGGCDSLIEIIVDSMRIAEMIDEFWDKTSISNATTKIYIKSGLNLVSDSSDPDSFISNFTKQATSDKTGYDMYVRNAE